MTSILLEFRVAERQKPEAVDSGAVRRGRIKERGNTAWFSTWIPFSAGMDVSVLARNLRRELANVGLAAVSNVEGDLKARIAERLVELRAFCCLSRNAPRP